MKSDLDAPGLKRLTRPSGRIDCYWVADPELVKRGYTPKTQRLVGDPRNPDDFLQMAATCRRLHAEMLEWKAGRFATGNRQPLGTISWLCDAFLTDPDSPYHELRDATQRFYDRYAAKIKETVGQVIVTKVVGQTVRRWHREWVDLYGQRGGYACVQTLRRVLSYGVEIGDEPALRLSGMLKHMEFKTPSKRKARPTYQQVEALRIAAHKAGRPSIALAITLQFDLGLRQKDVIGEWVTPGRAERQEIEGAITDGPRVWQWGLTWNQIDDDLVMRKPTSKSNGTEIAEHSLSLYPDVMAELMKIPPERRIGPVLIDEKTRRPWSAGHFSRQFRKIARAAGWPDDVWNMDSRAGAVSEAFEAGADAADVMRAATHRQMSTTMIYNRGGVVQSSRVAELRLARRQKKKPEA